MVESRGGCPCLSWFCILLFAILVCALFYPSDTANTSEPRTIYVGALVAFESVIGRAAKQAIELAVHDINRNDSLLNGSKIVLHTIDTNCSAFRGASAAMELLKKEVVAVAGPQSSGVSHFVAHMGGSTQVPLVSFAATDPALSEYQYPYFFRIAHTDAVQMAAVAAVIGYHNWREVVALYTDDDYGTNGAAVLGDALGNVGARIVQKAALAPGIDKTSIGSILAQLATMQSRVFVVHMQQDVGLLLFSEAKYLGMMSAGYVWIVSDSMAAVLDTTDLNDDEDALQGIIGTRSYIPDSPEVRSLVAEWEELQVQGGYSGQLNVYGLYAYDSMWLIAHALDSYLKNGSDLSFEEPVTLPIDAGGGSELAQLKVFKGGPLLRQQMLQTRFNGTTGPIQLNLKGDLMGSAFEIVNIVGKQMRVVGYWTNETGISVSPPGSVADAVFLSIPTAVPPSQLLDIIWPGNSTQTPRGWVLPKNGKPLRIAVPNKAGFRQFVSWSANSSNASSVHGFCIDVFQDALKYLPYAVPYTFVRFGNGSTTPMYDDMINQLANKMFDAAVGDITITTKRMEIVDFTQPYTESGLVVVVPIKDSHSKNAWAFLRPFTPGMWFTTAAFFVFTGIVVWMLEHKKNRDFRGNPKKQVVTVLWFTFSTLFFAQREKTKSTLGRFVVIIWLFVVLIITSSYTANLTSILTVQQLSPTIQGISSLQASNVPIGYQTGSYVRDYLIGLNIAKERLKPLPSMGKYAEALNLGPYRGGVAAIVDEAPYMQVFLDTQCGFTTAGQEFTKGGWGFTFPKDSELAIDMSTAILTLSEKGELQRIHDLWLNGNQCNSNDSEAQSSQLSLYSFWGLFLVTGLASLICLLIYIIRLLWQFTRRGDAITPDTDTSMSWSRSKRLISSFASYVDEPGTRHPDKSNKKRKEKNITQRSNQSSPDVNCSEDVV